MSQKFEVLNNLVKLAEKLGYVVNLISSYSEEVCLFLNKNNKRFHIFLDLENKDTNLIRQVLLEKNNNPPEKKYYTPKALENALKS